MNSERKINVITVLSTIYKDKSGVTHVSININDDSKVGKGGLGELQGNTRRFAELNCMAPVRRTLFTWKQNKL